MNSPDKLEHLSLASLSSLMRWNSYLFGPFASYEENEVLWILSLGLIFVKALRPRAKAFTTIRPGFWLFLFLIKGEIENWWDPATEQSYKEKAQCIIEQYGNYEAKQV